MESNRNLTRDRAAFAYSEVLNWPGPVVKEATQLAKGLPVALRTQELTVLVADLSRREQHRFTALLEIWLFEKFPARSLTPWDDPNAGRASRLLHAVVHADRASYLAAQREAMALLGQVKLFAEALHGKEGEPHGN